MARCELAIELDGDRTVFRAGESVSGRVVVRTDGDVRCDALIVELSWGTGGDALQSRSEAQQIELFRGELAAGVKQSYPFAFTLPAGPVSYRGNNVGVCWFLGARADIPWKIDPTAQTVIDVEANPELEPDWWALFERERLAPAFLRRAEEGQSGTDGEEEADGFTTSRRFGVVDFGCLGLALLFVVLGGWSLLNTVLAFLDGVTSWSEEWSRMLLEVGFFAISLLVAAWIIRSRIASRRLGALKLEIDPRLLRPGQTLWIRVMGTPRAKVELEGATCRLQATERAVAEKPAHERGSSVDTKNTETLLHRVHSQQVEVFEARTLAAKMPFQLQGSVEIPTDAAPTFAASNARLDWEVKLTLRVKGWPSWEAHRKIVVHP